MKEINMYLCNILFRILIAILHMHTHTYNNKKTICCKNNIKI